MTGKIKIILGVLVACLWVNVCCCAKDSNAMTCAELQNKGKQYNESLYNACVGSGARGALWVSSKPGGNELEPIVEYDGSDSEITVYVHGVVINNSYSVAANATCMIVFTGDREKNDTYNADSKGLNCAAGKAAYNGKKYNSLKFDAISWPNDTKGGWNSWGAYMVRAGVIRGNDLTSEVKSIKIKLADAIASSDDYEDEDGRRIYKTNLNFFRCYGGNETKNGSCYSEQSVLKISTPIPDSFQGISTVVKGYDADHNDWSHVGSSDRKGTDYMPGGDNNKAVLEISGCNDGCQWVRFGHGLRRLSGNGGVKYRVYRYVNDASIDPKGWVVGNENKFEAVSGFNGTSQKVVRSELQTMYTGQSICEQMGFYRDGESGLTGTMACAFAVGNVDTTLNIKVKNNSLGQTNYAGTTYARPGDDIDFLATYNPRVQELVNRVPEKMQINGVWKTNADKKTLKDAYNDNNGNDADWNNAFTVHSEGFSSVDFSKTYNYAVGDSDEKSERILPYATGDSSDEMEHVPSHTVSQGEVGRELKEIVNINENEQGSTTPKQVRYFNDNGSLTANVITDKYDVENNTDLVANVVVPYNFRNVPSVEGNHIMAYAGENYNIPYKITTELRANGLVGGDPYATIVEDAQWKTAICTDKYDINKCAWNEPDGGDLHTDISAVFSASEKTGNVFALIPDLPAGTEVYVRVAVYPAASSETNWWDPEGNHEWAYSDAAPITVVKKPSFQVWGGDIFVKDGVDVDDIPLANKIVLATSFEEHAPRKFGSWGELSVETGSGNTGNLFSGAALGFAGNVGGELSPNYSFLGDNDKTASYSGPGNNGSGINPGSSNSSGGGLNYSGGSMIDIGVLVGKLTGKMKEEDAEDVETVGAPDANLNPNSGESKMYKNENGTITIDGNIEYNGSYSTLESIPKVIIYANNIIINCNVERIDAILIAKENIETCPFAESDEKKNNLGSPARSVQLRINGAVIAGGSVSFDRSYGAGTGANSMIPAEIINMDPSWYLWAADSIGVSGASMEHDDTEGLMIPTYTCELPPRY